jgi:hypothetical protein
MVKVLLSFLTLIFISLTHAEDYKIKIVGKTAGSKFAKSKAMTLYAEINGKDKKLLCHNKKLSRNQDYTFECDSKIKNIDSITIIAEHHDGWVVDCFEFFLPNGEVWSFSGAPMPLSSQKKDILGNCQYSLTFYFTGFKIGRITSKNPYNKRHSWEKDIRGHKKDIPQPEVVTCPKCSHKFWYCKKKSTKK